MASAQAQAYLSTFSPEDQQAILSGGNLDAWFNAAVKAGAVPQEFIPSKFSAFGLPWGEDGTGPGAGTAAPRPTAPQGIDWANATAQQAGINPWSQDYKQEFDRTTNQMLAQMSPEQRARWSMEHLDALDYRTRESSFQQWLAWQKHFDPSCPSSAPYRAEDGSGCVEKPDNSNAGYQQGAQDGSGGVSGGAGRGKGGQQSLTSPLVDMLKNQGSFLGGYDPTRGDENPGIRGGVVGGGGIWWQPTAPQMSTPESMPRGGQIKNGSTDPLGPYGGVMGGQGTSRAGAPTTSVLGGTVLNANAPSPGGVRGAPLPTGGGIVDPWGPQKGSRGTGQPPLGPYGGIMGGQSPLTNVMAGIQGQNKAYNPLGSMMTPFQRKTRTAGSWFGG